MTKQTQKSGKESKNYQAEVMNINQGLSYTEAKEVALDVFRANFVKLGDEAKAIAAERAEKVTEDFLMKLQKENPQGLQNSQDPDFQYSLLTVQKEFARTGDIELGDLLVDLLVDRSKQDQRNILQIVLNESLNVAPKLTSDQLAALSIIFVFQNAEYPGATNFEKLGSFFDLYVKPFVNQLTKKQACFQHLEFTGCGAIKPMIGSGLQENIGNKYQGLFMKGFDAEEIEKRKVAPEMKISFIKCLNDNSKMQVNALNNDHLDKIMKKEGIVGEDSKKIRELFNLNKMSNDDIKMKCIEVSSYMEDVFDVWSNSYMQNFRLTSVGIAIGHANIKKNVGEFSDLSIWIN